MKRQRVARSDMDFRPVYLAMKIEETWDIQIQELHKQNQEQIRQSLIIEYGELNAALKLKNYIDLGNAPHSIIANHNVFLRQVRNAFVIGSYYPALTGACALGERILNNFILKLRNYYKNTPEYKRVYRKGSFDNWSLVIDILESWNVLLPKAVLAFKKLEKIRNKVIHFEPETDNNDREFALEAINFLSEIITEQFTAFGARPWLIPDTIGAVFIKKEWESNPFIQEFYLPNCILVGPKHYFEYDEENNLWIVHDNFEYDTREIIDEEFKDLFNSKALGEN